MFLFFDEGNNLIGTTIEAIYQKDFKNEKKNYKEYCNKKNMEYNWKDENLFSLNNYKDSIIEINKWHIIIK